MSELCLVLNLGSSSFKAALVDPTGAFPWQKSRSLESSDNLELIARSLFTEENSSRLQP